MNKDKVLEYMLANEKARYDANKELYKTIRSIIITVIVCLTISVCFFMYFVVPVEEEVMTADNGSQIVSESIIGKDNTNGL